MTVDSFEQCEYLGGLANGGPSCEPCDVYDAKVVVGDTVHTIHALAPEKLDLPAKRILDSVKTEF